MSEGAWLPGLLALAVGLAIGAAAALKIRHDRRRAPRRESLGVRDLERRRDELYRRLREEELSPGDREKIELEAARTLRQLDRAAPHAPAPRTPATTAAEPASAAPAAAAVPVPAAGTAPAGGASLSRRHPALVGFVAGLALAVLVGALVYLAMRDSGVSTATPAAAGGEELPHEETDALPAAVQRQLAELEAAAAAAPGDLLARKRLALGRLDAGLYFDAYRDAEGILAEIPEDPDGLFIQGVVRLAMGQNEPAIELLDRVLARFPEHLQAMVYRGLALAQSGKLEQAIATWELALEMAGGSHPELESLLAQARQQPPPSSAPPNTAAPPAAPPQAAAAAPEPTPPVTTTQPPPPSEPPPTASSPAAGGPLYRATVELPPGATVAPGAVLFVLLRPGEGGPPVAVKRIGRPVFPIAVELGAGDAMMGGELPDAGVLVARLDADGSASSRAPEDLEASAPAAIGSNTRLLLGAQ